MRAGGGGIQPTQSPGGFSAAPGGSKAPGPAAAAVGSSSRDSHGSAGDVNPLAAMLEHIAQDSPDPLAPDPLADRRFG